MDYFKDYKEDGHNWITLSTGEYYPDILPDACELYKPVLVLFSKLLRESESSKALLIKISETRESWMRIQLARVFRKYVSPETPVEMLKKKTKVQEICNQFGDGFRAIPIVQQKFESRPIPDEALCALLWEYKDRGKKGYDLTEKFFNIMRLSTLGLFACAFATYAANMDAQTAKVNITNSRMTIGAFIEQVEQETGYMFVYNKREVDANRMVLLKAGSSSVAD